MNLEKLKNKTVLITGGNGFIGRNLIEQLKEYSVNINVIDIIKSNIENLKQYTGSLSDKNFVKDSISKINPEIIFHLAANKCRSSDINDFYNSINDNLIGSLNLFTALKDLKSLKSILVLGTSEEYGHNIAPFNENNRENPISTYSFSKMCLTELSILMFKLYKLPIIVLRPSIAYGPNQGDEMFLPALINTLIKNKEFKMTKGEQKRDYVYINDLIDALIKTSITSEAVGEIINIGSGNPILIRDLALKVGNILNKKDLIKLGDIDYRKNEIMDYYLDITKARQILNWSPKILIDEGLKKILESRKK